MNCDKLWDEICKIKKEFQDQKEQIAKLIEENRALKERLGRMKKLVKRRGLPSELINEIFATMPLENSFGLLTEMPNGLLARNVRKILKGIKKAINGNKWNEADCGPELTISTDGLEVEHSGARSTNGIRALLPVLKLSINDKLIFYFEIEILNKTDPCAIHIGFCAKQFPLDRGIGFSKNSIGIYYKAGIMINGFFHPFKNPVHENFQIGDLIGIGIVRFSANLPMNFFASCNGKLLEWSNCRQNLLSLNFFRQLLCMAAIRSGRISVKKNGSSISINYVNNLEKSINIINQTNIRNGRIIRANLWKQSAAADKLPNMKKFNSLYLFKTKIPT